AFRTPLARVLARGRQRNTDQGLDRQIAAVLEVQRILRLPALDSMAPVAARAFAEAGLASLDVRPVTMSEIVDTTVAGPAGPLAGGICVPKDVEAPWIVFFQGGGGVIGSVASSESVARLLASQTRCTVASGEYRLGPEHRPPAAIQDACAAW